jgi:cytochrome c
MAVAMRAGSAAALEGNAEEGAEVFKKCRACHDLGPAAQNKVGPVLNGIIGRKAGTIEGFPYSDANRAAGAKGLVWTEDVLFKYLENPLVFMKGTKMAFAGLRDPQDRKDVIAYLKKFGK